MDITARRGDTIINVHKDMAISNTRFPKNLYMAPHANYRISNPASDFPEKNAHHQ